MRPVPRRRRDLRALGLGLVTWCSAVVVVATLAWLAINSAGQQVGRSPRLSLATETATGEQYGTGAPLGAGGAGSLAGAPDDSAGDAGIGPGGTGARMRGTVGASVDGGGAEGGTAGAGVPGATGASGLPQGADSEGANGWSTADGWTGDAAGNGGPGGSGPSSWIGGGSENQGPGPGAASAGLGGSGGAGGQPQAASGSSGQPGGSQTPVEARAGASSATSTPTSPSGRSSEGGSNPTPSPTGRTSSPTPSERPWSPDEVVRATQSTVGGVVTAECRHYWLASWSASPQPGWSVLLPRLMDRSVQIGFQLQRTTIVVQVSCGVDGAPSVTVVTR